MYIPLTFEGALQKCLIASSSNGGMFVSGGIQYEYHYITASTTFEVQVGSLEAQLLVVGGGGGGMYTTNGGAGGGGGEVYYNPNQRLYKGTYTITIGKGGAETVTGGNTIMAGSNLSITAIGGQGATGSVGGSSGNGFAGGTSQTAGGGGGGATSTGSSVSTLTPSIGGNGGDGFSISMANYVDLYGCGGGGGASTLSNAGDSCRLGYGGGGTNSATGEIGAPNRGGGGGGAGTTAGSGSDGIIVIQYPINRYCSTFFNQTGSCACAQLTFDTTDPSYPSNYYPDQFGTYLYLPCNGTTYVSGSIESFYPKTVCAASGSYYLYSTIYSTSPLLYAPVGGFVTGGPQCSTGSVCANPNTVYTPNCSESKIIAFGNLNGYNNFLNPSAVGYFVPRNSGSIAEVGLPVKSVRYRCAVTASGYPLGVLGGYAKSGSASCVNYSLNGVLQPPGNSIEVKYYDCGGTLLSASFTAGSSTTRTVNYSFCADTSFITPQITYTGTPPNPITTNIGGDCLTGSLKPTCGCP